MVISAKLLILILFCGIPNDGQVIGLILRPTYIDRIMAYTNTPFVKILAGVRRCGKSTILKMVAAELCHRGVSEDRILLYSFDSLQHEDIKTAKALYDEIKGKLLTLPIAKARGFLGAYSSSFLPASSPKLRAVPSARPSPEHIAD